jgi:hypothetical protein
MDKQNGRLNRKGQYKIMSRLSMWKLNLKGQYQIMSGLTVFKTQLKKSRHDHVRVTIVEDLSQKVFTVANNVINTASAGLTDDV